MSIKTRALEHGDMAEAVDLVARAMLDNPIHVTAFGRDAARREAALHAMFTAVLGHQLSRGIVLGLFRGGKLAGVAGMLPPGRCPSALTGKLTAVSTLLLGSGLAQSRRVQAWLEDWAKTDSAVEHWHFGPIAIDSQLQRTGLGSILLRDCCEQMDGEGMAAYLENDKEENLPFFERFAFAVETRHEVLGVPTWFMLRPGQE